MSRPVWYDSSETGAPSLNNLNASSLEVLRACLKNGFNLRAVTSIVVVSGVATATAATHGYSAAYGKLLRIEGAPLAGLNGDVQPLSVDTNTFTYACPGVPDGTYSGTITARRAPLDWAEVFTGTNTAIFARTDLAAGSQMLRVSDTGAGNDDPMNASVQMIESASGIDSIAGATPTVGVGFWHKGPNSATPKRWILIGTGRGFYFFTPSTYSATPGAHQQAPMWFGDGVPYFALDPHFCLLSASHTKFEAMGYPTSRLGTVDNLDVPATQAGLWVARARNGLGAGRVAAIKGVNQGVQQIGGPGKGQSNINNLVIAGPFWLMDDNVDFELRGEFPGLATGLARHEAYDNALPFALFQGAAGIGDRTYLRVQVSAGASTASSIFVDLTGPWYG